MNYYNIKVFNLRRFFKFTLLKLFNSTIISSKSELTIIYPKLECFISTTTHITPVVVLMLLPSCLLFMSKGYDCAEDNLSLVHGYLTWLKYFTLHHLSLKFRKYFVIL